MEAVFFEVLNRSISASWLILAIILLRLLLKKAPKWIICALWAFVAVRLISPFSIESVISLIPSAETISPNIVYAQQPAIHSGIDVLNSSINPIIQSKYAPSPEMSANPLQIHMFISTIIWLAGCVVMLLYAMFSWLLICRKVRVSLSIGPNIHICDHIQAPFILGVVRPKIYLPSDLSPSDTASVLSHEQAHLKRKDHWWKPLGFLLLSITWFNPLAWISYVLLCRDIEAACDEKVIKNLSLEDRKVYSTALLNCSTSRHQLTACPLAFGETSVKLRIKKVMNYKKPGFWILLIALALSLVTALCFLTDPKSASKPELETPFGRTYADSDATCIYYVSEIVYNAPQYSFTYTPETAPLYRLTQNNEIEILEAKDTESWLTPGQMKAFSLTKENFVDLCRPSDSTDIFRSLLKENANSWKVDVLTSDNGTFHYILQQKDDTLYYCLGYHRIPQDVIRWIFKLDKAIPISQEQNVETAPATADIDPLEAAIHDAIIEHNRHRSPNYSGDVFICESHIIFDEQTLVACGAEHSYSETTVYLMALYQEYDLSDGTIKDKGGSHMPIALTFEVTEDEYLLTEHWTPGDGTYYLPSIQEKFPEHCWALASDTQAHILKQIQSCYSQAVEYGNLDTDKILDDLYSVIENHPSYASAPDDRSHEQSIAYREITYYGMYALEHAYKQFLSGELSDFHAHMLAFICQDIFNSIGEPFRSNGYTTGQEWFAQFQEYAQALESVVMPIYSSQYRPAIRLLLSMQS